MPCTCRSSRSKLKLGDIVVARLQVVCDLLPYSSSSSRSAAIFVIFVIFIRVFFLCI
jgi:hypothetical protein